MTQILKERLSPLRISASFFRGPADAAAPFPNSEVQMRRNPRVPTERRADDGEGETVPLAVVQGCSSHWKVKTGNTSVIYGAKDNFWISTPGICTSNFPLKLCQLLDYTEFAPVSTLTVLSHADWCIFTQQSTDNSMLFHIWATMKKKIPSVLVDGNLQGFPIHFFWISLSTANNVAPCQKPTLPTRHIHPHISKERNLTVWKIQCWPSCYSFSFYFQS